MLNLKKFQKSEKGNALFLILIAVALFAALSYAITQSSRGGGGVDREQALIAASQLTQYAAGLRTAITRMTITGTDALDLEFDNDDSAPSDEVFNTAGGGAIEQEPPSNAGTGTDYHYLVPTDADTGWFIEDIGGADNTKADVIIATSGLSEVVCAEINRGLGLEVDLDAASGTNGATVTYDTAATWDGTADQATVFNAPDAVGEPFACVLSGTDFVYYHALAEL